MKATTQDNAASPTPDRFARAREFVGRGFAVLFLAQCLAALLLAHSATPAPTAHGGDSPGWHLWALGGLTFVGTLFVGRRPVHRLTPYAVACLQVLYSAVFSVLFASEPQSACHILLSCALIACYRDWRVLSATTVAYVALVCIEVTVSREATSSHFLSWGLIPWICAESAVLAYGCLTLEREHRSIERERENLNAERSRQGAEMEERTEELQQSLLVLEHQMVQRKLLESQLVEAQKLESIGQLAAGIAHEINTPAQYVGDNTRFLQREFGEILVVLDRYAGWLAADGPKLDWSERQQEMRKLLETVDFPFLREEIPKAIEQSLDGMDRITHIVRAMKDFSHPGTTTKEPADLNKAIESTITVCTNRWKYAADIVTEFDPNLPPVPCLVGEFNQVILNLIVNAADAIDSHRKGTTQKGRITVRTRREGDDAIVDISDTGGGVPEEIRHRIFDPFFTTKPVGQGTGQGLAISRDHIVKKHGGQLTCHVDSGIGSTFTIRLPLHMQRSLSEAA